MQETRRYILDILRREGTATVDEIVDQLRSARGDDITSVTVRHHLARLQEEGLITSPQLRRRATPGRPQHVYALSPKAREQFPSNYQRLLSSMLDELRRHLPAEGVNVIMDGVAQSWARTAGMPNLPMHERMDFVVHYLNQQGYEAHWESTDEGIVLHTTNCPYHSVAETSDALCEMDMRLVAMLVDATPRRLSHIVVGDQTCSYLIPARQETQ
jgi:DeoR family transcriptional regulator, suf operon transcriptional repressor